MTDGVDDVRFVLLDCDEETIARRVDARTDHFAGSALLPSQFALLDPPADAIVLDAVQAPEDLVASAVAALRGGAGDPTAPLTGAAQACWRSTSPVSGPG